MTPTRSSSASSARARARLIKTLLWRMLLFGRHAFVLDVKREYGPLCEAAGVEPISLRPGGGVRLNPLASRPEEHAQLELLRAITVTALGGPLTQVEAAALREALHTVQRRVDLPSRRYLRSRPCCSRRSQRWPAVCERPRSASRVDSPARGAGASGSLRRAAAGHVRRPDHPRPEPRRAAARARPACGPGLAGGGDPDGVRQRVDERAAGERGRADPGATGSSTSPTSRGRSSSTRGSASGFSRTSSSRGSSA